MTGAVFPFETVELIKPRLGLIALQSDETIEADMRRLLPADVELMVSRVPSAEEVSSDTLAAMEGDLSQAAALFPKAVQFDAIAYGCTSGTAQIGVDTVAAKIKTCVDVQTVTQPLSSLVAACAHMGIVRLAMLSPYVTSVSARLRDALAKTGIETPRFGSFEVAQEATVVRIDPASIRAAALQLMHDAEVDALFLSCTNLRTLDVIAPLEDELGKPVLSSNQVLAWHLMQAAGCAAPVSAPGRLFLH
ncbi:MAG: Asp/Glu racemase [Roseobacter sp.]